MYLCKAPPNQVNEPYNGRFFLGRGTIFYIYNTYLEILCKHNIRTVFWFILLSSTFYLWTSLNSSSTAVGITPAWNLWKTPDLPSSAEKAQPSHEIWLVGIACGLSSDHPTRWDCCHLGLKWIKHGISGSTWIFGKNEKSLEPPGNHNGFYIRLDTTRYCKLKFHYLVHRANDWYDALISGTVKLVSCRNPALQDPRSWTRGHLDTSPPIKPVLSGKVWCNKGLNHVAAYSFAIISLGMFWCVKRGKR